jgi:hypothetical protein
MAQEPPDDQAQGETEGPQLPDATKHLEREIRQMERQITALLRNRERMDPQVLSVRIDLRLLRRTLLRSALAGGVGEASTQVAMLRANDLLPLIEAADAMQTVPAAASSAVQALHERTYLESEPDALLDGLGSRILLILDHPAAGQPLPRVRPNVQNVREKEEESSPLPETPDTPESLARRTRALAVTLELRRALDDLVAQASADDAEATLLATQAVAAAEALAANVTGLDPEQKRQVEADLATAATVASDPRLRGLGAELLEKLGNFSQAAEAADDLPRGGGDLAPLLAAAGRDSAWTETLLQVVRDYETQRRRHEAMERDVVRLPVVWSRQITQLLGEFDQMQSRLVSDARRFGRDDGAGSTLFTKTPEDFVAAVTSLREINDVTAAAASLATTTKAIETALNVRPVDALERSVMRLLVRSVSPTRDDDRDEARRLLIGAGQFPSFTEKNDPFLSSVEALRTRAAAIGVDLDELARAYRQEVSAMATALADGDVGSAEMEQRSAALAAYSTLAESAAALGDALALAGQADALLPWADWAVTSEAAMAVYEPARAAMAKAASSLGSVEGDEALAAFEAEMRRTEPMTRLLQEVVPLADQLPVSEDVVLLAAARLETPSRDEPFARERFASAALLAWVAIREDPAADREGAEAIFQRLSTLADE